VNPTFKLVTTVLAVGVGLKKDLPPANLFYFGKALLNNLPSHFHLTCSRITAGHFFKNNVCR